MTRTTLAPKARAIIPRYRCAALWPGSGPPLPASLRGRRLYPHSKVLNTWTLDVLDGRIQTIRSVINPDKLGHVGPVADAWAVIREANQARRPPE